MTLSLAVALVAAVLLIATFLCREYKSLRKTYREEKKKLGEEQFNTAMFSVYQPRSEKFKK
jgi:hypothetical protein